MEETAMTMEASLQKSGWHLIPSSLFPLLLDNPSISQLHRLLLDSDLAHFGVPCLPDASSLPRTSRLQGPLVLQVVFVRNICESSSKSLVTGQQQQGRLLRIGLTDGHTLVSAIEYHSMPAFSLNTAPGTKVKLENNIPIEKGILLGDARSLTVLGGHVQALYEAWEIERKYSGLARPTLKSSRVEGDSGPPAFHGLPVAKQGRQHAENFFSAGQLQQSNLHVKENALQGDVTRSTPGPSTVSRLGDSSKGHLQGKVGITLGRKNERDNDEVFPLRIRPGSKPYRPRLMMKTSMPEVHNVEKGNESSIYTLPEFLLSPEATKATAASASDRTKNKAVQQQLMTSDISSSNIVASSEKDLNIPLGDLSKEMARDVRVDAIKAAIALGVETAPLQNRAAAQKLLEKRTDSHPKTFPGRGRGASSKGRERRFGRHGRPGMDEQQSTLTLDEWESRKGIQNASGNQCTDGDAALAQKLQYELNLENREVSSSRTAFDEAEQIRLSMFNFAVDRSIDEHDGERHRGRGRGRGRRRGR